MTSRTRTLTVGDFAPLLSLPDQNGKRVILRDKVGKPLLLLFYANDNIDTCAKTLHTLKTLMAAPNAPELDVISISADRMQDRKAFADTHDIPFVLLSDPEIEVMKRYGVGIASEQEGLQQMSVVRTALLLDRNLRIRRIYSPLVESEIPLTQILQEAGDMFPPQPVQHLPMHAPVLILPHVIERDLCAELIDLYHTQGNKDSGFMKKDPNDPYKTVGVYDYETKIRRDHFVTDSQWLTRLDGIIKRRVFPEIKKCFNYEATRREAYKVSCYDGATGGYFRRHRDNTTGGTVHRVWAMTLNLNAEDYDGGYLCFPEYGPFQYKPETGSAVIFSCSMMHEATDVLSGKRFALLSFFYGDREAEERRRYNARFGSEYEILNAAEANVR